MRTMSCVSLALACLAYSAPSSAQWNSQCHAEEVFGVYDTIDCYEKENKALIGKLNLLYEDIKKIRIDDEYSSYIPSNRYLVDSFTESQKSWNKFVSSNCSMKAIPASVSQGAGSGLMERACYNEAYHHRVAEIEAWIKDIQETYNAR